MLTHEAIYGLIMLGFFYVVMGIIIAFGNIRRNENYCRYMDSVPYGDLEFYGEGPSLFDGFCFVFVTALPILLAYILICKIANKFY